MKRVVYFIAVLFLFSLAGFTLPDNTFSVKIGKQEWTSENLNALTFRNGDTIPEAESDSDWVKAGRNRKPAWCNYYNNPESGNMFGKLYNWYAVSDPRGLAPEGWHIPAEKEWKTLINNLGGYKTACLKLKSKVAWDGDGNGDNSTGFSAIPAGQRIVESGFSGLSNLTCFWSSTQKKDDQCFYLPLTRHGDLSEWSYFKTAGFSVRCIKDNSDK